MKMEQDLKLNSEIKPLPVDFWGRGEVRGKHFSVVMGTDGIAYMYKVTDADGDTYYEVFKHKINRRFGMVSYPTANNFGVWAWCINNYDKALEKYSKLVLWK